jgi:LPPG:FO 2-phospho-L-lactate transferase
MIVALAGGVGAARFLSGFPQEELFVIVNTADDTELYGLHISPDLDTVTYTLAGLSHPKQGWGLRSDTFQCLQALSRFTPDTWFRLGDRDLATHLYRTRRLSEGATLTEVTREITRALGIIAIIIPMSNDPVRTGVLTPSGELDFQTWFVRRRHRDRVVGVRFRGVRAARPAPGILRALHRARAILICPSNPIISIGPILTLPGLRAALRTAPARKIAVSPLIAGRALKGPAAHMMKDMGLRPDSLGVAELYRDFLDLLVLDRADRSLAPAVHRLGIPTIVTNIILDTPRRRRALAGAILNLL